MVREIKPQPGPQEAFLSSPADVVLYGGGAGSGKSFALLLDPLRYVGNPGFGAVIFRRTLAEITQEREPGQSGKSQVDHYALRVLKGYTVRGVRPTGDKVTRAEAASAAWSRSEILLVAGPWVELVLSLLDRFPSPGVHDEPADLLSQFWQVRMVEEVGWVAHRLRSVLKRMGQCLI